MPKRVIPEDSDNLPPVGRIFWLIETVVDASDCVREEKVTCPLSSIFENILLLKLGASPASDKLGSRSARKERYCHLLATNANLAARAIGLSSCAISIQSCSESIPRLLAACALTCWEEQRVRNKANNRGSDKFLFMA